MDRVDYQPLIIQDLVNWYKNEELELDPWYQRRSVWTRPQKAYLMNTLFEQKPVPTLYFRHTVDLDKDRSLREVVDGQQRIRALFEYLNDEYAALHPSAGKKLKYSSLTSTNKRQLRETKLSGGWLLGASDADVIEIFGRLNSVSKTLNPMERRNANFSGDFKQFCLKEASSRIELWRTLGVFTANDIARMVELEFVSDLALNMLNGLSDFTPKALDALYDQYDDSFPKQQQLSKRFDSVFTRLASIPVSAIRDSVFQRKPVFFSLFLELDALPGAKGNKLEDALAAIDRRYNSDKPVVERTKSDAAFYDACRSSTQRIASRRVRSRYIRKFLK